LYRYTAACGVAVADPLEAYKAKFFKKGDKPVHSDGTLHYTHADVDLAALNANHALLQACWVGALYKLNSVYPWRLKAPGFNP
jgi:hypothetical protein